MNIDSLKNELGNAKSDSVKNLIYSGIIEYYTNVNPEIAYKYIDELQDFAKKNGNNNAFYRGEIFKSIVLAQTDGLDKSNKVLLKVLENKSKITEGFILATVNMNLGLNNLRKSKYDKAAEYFDQAIILCKKYNLNDVLASCYVSMALLNTDLGNFDISEKYYFQALELAIKIKIIDMQAMVHNNLATVYLKQDKYDKALEHLNKAMAIYNVNKNFAKLAISYHNKASIMTNLEKFDEAIEYLKKSIELKKIVNNEIGIGISYLALAQTYKYKNDITNAKDYLAKAFVIFKKNNARKLLISSYKFEEEIYTDTRDFQKAYESLKHYYDIQDSIADENNRKLVTELNTKFEVANKEKENAILKSNSERQKYIIIISILSLVIIAGILIAMLIKNRTMKKINRLLNDNKIKIETQNNELENLNTELSLLNDELTEANYELRELNSMKDKFFSIISHDLKSPISSQFMILNAMIDNYNDFTESEKNEYINLVYESTKNTYDLLENLLSWGRAQLNRISLHRENFNPYFVVDKTIQLLESQASYKKIELVNNFPEDVILYADPSIFATLIRNLTINSIKYSKAGDKIEINYFYYENKHQISVKDTGMGMKKNILENLFKLDNAVSVPGTNNEKGTGLGLIICKEFVEMHGGSIWVESKEGEGSTFYFSIPVTVV